eukprot:m.112916 g.112916  ORF g.112916 m.112916 type:complete len:65 (-) comp9259_c1_seq1:4714-4908(-)
MHTNTQNTHKIYTFAFNTPENRKVEQEGRAHDVIDRMHDGDVVSELSRLYGKGEYQCILFQRNP